jgi:hypothetical protein
VWLAIANLAVVTYFGVFGGILGVAMGPLRQLWLHFALNTAALVIWEVLGAAGVAWLRARWAARVLVTASGGLATALAVNAITDQQGTAALAGVAGWLAWLAVAYAVHRRRIPDLYVLAGGVLSVIVVVVALILQRLDTEATTLLLTAVVVVGLSAAGAAWLRRVAREP